MDQSFSEELHPEDVIKILSQFITPQDPKSSLKCTLDGLNYITNIGNVNESWAGQMFDATATLTQSGLLEGNFIHLPGSYSSCLKAKAPDFSGKHCMVTTYVDESGAAVTTYVDESDAADLYQLQSQIHLDRLRQGGQLGGIQVIDIFRSLIVRYGICIPSSCSDYDLAVSMSLFLNEALPGLTNMSVGVWPLSCHTADEEVTLDKNDWGMIYVLIVFLIFIVFGTLVDMAFIVLKPNPRLNRFVQIFQGFSVYHNTRKIFNTKSGSDNLSCINGIRFLSMSWVLIGHTFMNFQPQFLGTSVLINNFVTMFDPDGPLSTPAMAVIWNAQPSVDSFFLIGAVLLSYLTLKQLDKEDGGSPKMWVMFYVHRYLRLTGVYAIVIGLVTTLSKYMFIGSAAGPQSQSMDAEYVSCRKWWWWNVLYINNFGEHLSDEGGAEYGCLGHTWYMANDMQFFIISPLIIFPLWYFNKRGKHLINIALTLPWLIAATMTPLGITIQDDISFGGNAEFGKFYDKPWNRFQPYLIGLYVGFLLHKYKKVTKPVPMLVALLGWAVATVLGASVVYGIARYSPVAGLHPSLAERAVYNCLGRISWSLALGWLIVACVKGFGGVINQLLSWSAFVPLARLSYTTYLIHITLITYINSLQTYTISFSNLNATYQALANLLLCTSVAYLMVVCFEAPILHLEKLLFAGLGISKLPPVHSKATENPPPQTVNFKAENTKLAENSVNFRGPVPPQNVNSMTGSNGVFVPPSTLTDVPKDVEKDSHHEAALPAYSTLHMENGTAYTKLE